MNCPQCGLPMEYHDEGFFGRSIGEWDVDLPYWHSFEVYRCRRCKIKNAAGTWEIPAKFERPTEAQLRAVKFIQAMLGIDFEPVLKKQCHTFIRLHLDDAKEQAEEVEMNIVS